MHKLAEQIGRVDCTALAIQRNARNYRLKLVCNIDQNTAVAP